MFKKGIVRRITISTMALIIFLITYLFPTKIEINEYKQNLSYQDIKKTAIYVMSDEKLVSRVQMVTKNTDIIAKIKEILSALTIGNPANEYIPSSFSPMYPFDL